MAPALPALRHLARRALERAGVLAPSRYMGDYLQRRFIRALRGTKVATIFEFGCGDGDDTLRLRDHFGAFVHAFECNPAMLPLLRSRLDGEPGVRLVEAAVWDADGTIPFYPVVQTIQAGQEISNPGASSCFRTVSGYHQEYVQTEATVRSMRLDTYCDREGVRPPDLLCIDAQGAALKALHGMGRHLRAVQAVIIEIEHREIFVGGDLYPAIDDFLRRAEFRQAVMIEHDGWYNNYLYRRHRR
jgi:FkbM family methyltransferase